MLVSSVNFDDLGEVPPISRDLPLQLLLAFVVLEDVITYNAAITKSTWTLAGGMFKVGRGDGGI